MKLNQELEDLVELTDTHGNTEGNDCQIAELKQLLRALWQNAAPRARLRFLRCDDVAAVKEAT